jgi:asparagine synthase (glutamine-hydrolysing)
VDAAAAAIFDLHPMLEAVRARAPDGTAQLVTGPVHLGQAHLRTGSGAREQIGRMAIDERVALAGDVRLDERADLVRELRQNGCDAASEWMPDGELVLHAYHAFGDDFLDHIQGDFALALWDARERKLILARDRFGVRPLHIARLRGELLFASHVESLLAVPGVSRELDRTALADFLLWGFSIDTESTIYTAIRCIPPAHRCDIREGGMQVRRYWSLRPRGETRFADPRQYVERFSELFARSVQARLPDAPYAVLLSGGMDSGSIAAAAVQRASHPASAYHVAPGSLLPHDDEEQLARAVAQHFGLRFVAHELDARPMFAHVGDPGLKTAFPSPAPHLGVHGELVADMASRSERVLLSGHQGDAAVFPSFHYYSDLFRHGHWWKLAREIRHHILCTGSLRGMGLRSIVRTRVKAPDWKPAFPDWLDPSQLDVAAARARWGRWWREYQEALDPDAQLSLPWAHRTLELYDILPLPVVTRYPFLDVALVEFLLGLPNFARTDKWILRESMKGSLPECVRARPKTGARGDTMRESVTNGKLIAWNGHEPIAHGVEPGAYQRAWSRYRAGHGAESTWASWLMMHPIAFAHWFQQQESSDDGNKYLFRAGTRLTG